MEYTLFLRILIPSVCPLVAAIARLNMMVTYSLNHHDYHLAALARGISLHQCFPERRARSMSAPPQSCLLVRRGLCTHSRADRRAH